MPVNIVKPVGGYVDDPGPNARIGLSPELPIALPSPTSPFGLPDPLPKPPTPGSPAEDAELGMIHALQATRNAERDAWAINLDQNGAINVWRDEAKDYRSHVSWWKGWLGTAAVATTMATTAVITGALKLRYHRARPFQVDSTLTALGPNPHGASYPSGHSSASFAAATMLSALEPSHQIGLYGLAGQVAMARVYSAVHFPSDVVVGAQVGRTIANHMITLFGIRHWASPPAADLAASITAPSAQTAGAAPQAA